MAKVQVQYGQLFMREKSKLLEQTDLPEGARVLVTLLPEEETEFWLHASQTSLDTVWNNTEPDVYAQQ